RRAATPVGADDAEAPFLVGLRDGQLEVEVPHQHAGHVVQRTRHLERLDQEVRLVLLGQVRAVLVASRRRGVRAVAELGEPDLLTALVLLDHQAAVLAYAGEREEAVIVVEAPGQAALGRGRCAVRRIGKAARVRRATPAHWDRRL